MRFTFSARFFLHARGNVNWFACVRHHRCNCYKLSIFPSSIYCVRSLSSFTQWLYFSHENLRLIPALLLHKNETLYLAGCVFPQNKKVFRFYFTCKVCLFRFFPSRKNQLQNSKYNFHGDKYSFYWFYGNRATTSICFLSMKSQSNSKKIENLLVSA